MRYFWQYTERWPGGWSQAVGFIFQREESRDMDRNLCNSRHQAWSQYPDRVRPPLCWWLLKWEPELMATLTLLQSSVIMWCWPRALEPLMSEILFAFCMRRNNYLGAGLAYSKQRILSTGHIQEEDSSLQHTVFVFTAPASKRILDTWPRGLFLKLYSLLICRFLFFPPPRKKTWEGSFLSTSRVKNNSEICFWLPSALIMWGPHSLERKVSLAPVLSSNPNCALIGDE